jgi:hypothetical protein
MRRRGGLNKIGILAIALIIALGAVGVTYSAWVEEIYINGSLYTGDINASVECNGDGSVSPDPYPIDTGITCSPTVYPMKLQFLVNYAVPNLTYYCSFKVNNLDDDPFDPFKSLPIKIDEDNTTLTPQGQGDYTDIKASVINPDPQIDPGETVTSQVKIVVGPDATAGQNLVYILEVKVVRWNK